MVSQRANKIEKLLPNGTASCILANMLPRLRGAVLRQSIDRTRPTQSWGVDPSRIRRLRYTGKSAAQADTSVARPVSKGQ